MAEHVPASVEEQLNQLRMLEQNVQSLSSQRQSFQMQLMELENAAEALDTGEGPAFKMTGQILLGCERKDLKKELTSQKEVLALRVKTLEKQEHQLREKAAELQKKIVDVMGKGKQ